MPDRKWVGKTCRDCTGTASGLHAVIKAPETISKNILLVGKKSVWNFLVLDRVRVGKTERATFQKIDRKTAMTLVLDDQLSEIKPETDVLFLAANRRLSLCFLCLLNCSHAVPVFL